MKLTIEQAQEMMNNNGGWLDLRGTAITELPQGLTVGGWFDLSQTAITELPQGLTVGGSLYLSQTAITELPQGLTVGDGLDLRGTAITELPQGLTVGGGLYLSQTAITELPQGLTVGGSLDLSQTAITELPQGLTVGGSLDLSQTAITELPQGLTVGGSLDLSQTAITELPQGLTVGGWLYLRGTSINKKETEKVKRLKQGDYIEGNYLYADGILRHIKHCKKIKEYKYYVGKIKNKDVIYDGTNYAHCKDFKSGVMDLEFKKAKDRGAGQYRHLTLDSIISKDEAIVMYRVITGACQQGTEDFVNEVKEPKESYSIREIIEITKGKHGNNILKQFFNI